MCYNLSFEEKVESVYDYLPELRGSAQIDINFEPAVLEAGFTYPSHPVVVRFPKGSPDEGKLSVQDFDWGFVPDYSKATVLDRVGNRDRLLNARAERIIQDKRSVWYRNKHKRVLIPATGFFEHREVGAKKKTPYYIRLKDRKIFMLPGIYTRSHIPNEAGKYPVTFALVIRAANGIMRAIHNSGDNPFRMPLMLPPDLEELWLDPNLPNEGIQQILNYEMPSSELEYWTVKSIYRGARDDKSLIVPFKYENEPPVEEAS